MKNMSISIKFLAKSLLGRKNYLIVAVAAIVFGTSLVAALISISLDVGEKVGGALRSYGANVVLIPKQQSLSLTDNIYINNTSLEKLKSKPPEYIVGYSSYLYGSAKINDQKISIAGIDPKLTRKLNPWWQVEGNWLSHQIKDETLVGIDLAKQFNLKPGDQIKITPVLSETEKQTTTPSCQLCHRTLSINHSKRIISDGNNNCLNCHSLHNIKSEETKTLVVKGIIKSGGAEDEQIFVHLKDAQSFLNRPNLLSEIQVSVLTNRFSINQIGKKLEHLMPGTKAQIIKQIANAESTLLKKVQLLMGLVTVLILGASMLSVSSTTTVNIMQRSREIGLMKALGATGAGIMALFLIETTIVGLAGGLIGYFLGFAFAQIIGRSVFETYIGVQPIIIFITLFIAVTISLGSSVLPIRRALKTKPAITLRGE